MEPPSPGITVINQSGRRVRTLQLRQAAALALQRHRLSGETTILLTDDEHIRELNRQFRQVDEPTDVLTFPTYDPSGPAVLRVSDFPGDVPAHTLRTSGPEGSAYLGDIAISVPYAERQAKARRVSLSQELGFLAIHGALHLAGFDDEEEEDRKNMVAEMNAIAIQAGLRPDEEWHSLLHGEAA